MEGVTHEDIHTLHGEFGGTRVVRIVAGLGLMVWGIAMGGTGGTILAVVGILPLAAGGLDFCILAPLFGEPLSGKEIRKRSL